MEAKFKLNIEMTEEGVLVQTEMDGKGMDIIAMISAAIKDEPEIRYILKTTNELLEFADEDTEVLTNNKD